MVQKLSQKIFNMNIVATVTTTENLIEYPTDQLLRIEVKSKSKHKITWKSLITGEEISKSKSKQYEKEFQKSNHGN